MPFKVIESKTRTKPKAGMKMVCQKSSGYSRYGREESAYDDPIIKTVRAVGTAFVMFDDDSKMKIKDWIEPASAARIKQANERIAFLKDWSKALEEDREFDLKKSRETYKLSGRATITLSVAGLTIKDDDDEINLADLPPEIARDIETFGFERGVDENVQVSLYINGQKFFLSQYGSSLYVFKRAK